MVALTTEGVSVGVPVLLTLPPGGQMARFVHQDLSLDNYFQGSILIRSLEGGPFLAVALAQVNGLLTTVPVFAGSSGS
jgi:hypothetical protein